MRNFIAATLVVLMMTTPAFAQKKIFQMRNVAGYLNRYVIVSETQVLATCQEPAGCGTMGAMGAEQWMPAYRNDALNAIVAQGNYSVIFLGLGPGGKASHTANGCH